MPELSMIGFWPYPKMEFRVRVFFSATLAQEMVRVAVAVGIGDVGLGKFPHGVDALLARGGVHVVLGEDLFGGRGASNGLANRHNGR